VLRPAYLRTSLTGLFRPRTAACYARSKMLALHGGGARDRVGFPSRPACRVDVGSGPVTRARLAEIGVHTIGQLAKMPGYSLEQLLGRRAAGEKLTALAWNRDPREIRTHHRVQSAGAQSALGKKPAEEQVFRPTLRHLADRVASRLRAKSRPGRTVTVRIRFADLQPARRRRLYCNSLCSRHSRITFRREYKSSPRRGRVFIENLGEGRTVVASPTRQGLQEEWRVGDFVTTQWLGAS
jgi:impB/mucB/samB family C-terminal domain